MFIEDPVLLGTQNVAGGPDGKRPLQRVAELTDGCTGNDLHEICCEAAAIPVQELVDATPCEAREGDDELEQCGPLLV